MFTVGIITASDKGYKGEREDKSGVLIKEYVESQNYHVKRYVVLPDCRRLLEKEMIHMADELNVNLIFTTGGTGFSPRDNTPEATQNVIEKQAYGITEAIRYYSLQITKRAMLSRAISGIRGKTLIINLPGSPKAVKESLDFILDSISHGLEVLLDKTSDCARK